MTALARDIPDPDRSLARQLNVRSLPAGARIALGLLAATLLLWPLAPLLFDARASEAWSTRTASATWFSLWQGALAATLGVALSIPIGWSLARLAVPARRLVRALLTVPIVLPPLGIALGASWMLPAHPVLLPVVNASFGLAVGVRLGGGAWLALDPRESETARTLGLNEWQMIRWHLVPALGRPVLAAWALAFALAVSAFATAHLLTSGSRTALPLLVGSTEGTEVAPPAAGAAVVLVLIVGAALAVFVRYRPDHATFAGDVEYRALAQLAPRERVLLAGSFLLAAATVLAPIVALLHGTVTIGASEQVTGGNIAAIFEDARPFEVDALDAIQRSLILGVAAFLIALPLGLAIAIVIAPLRGWAAVAVETALLLPLLLSVALASGLRMAGLDSSLWLLFVHVGIALPLLIRVLLPGARSRLRSQFEAATLLGASRWESWNRLAAGSIRAQLAIAGVLTLTWSMGEVGAALLLQRLDTAPASAAIALALEQRSATADGRAFALAGCLALLVTILFVTIEYRRSREITEF